MKMAAPPRLEVRKISKRFAGVRALSDIDLTLGDAEVLALVGENGAGKSTLMKILAGVTQPDQGQILVDGTAVEFADCRAAMQRGIVLIHQELNLADNLDVGANIFLGREPLRFGLVDRGTIDRQSRKYLEMVGLAVSPRRKVSMLSIGQQQLVEIAKALSVNARVLIMDEPTSSLSSRESERLFEVVEDLRRRGVSVIYISHRLGEVLRLADRVEVLRDGRNAGSLSGDQIRREAMVSMMVGRDISQLFHREPNPPGDMLLEVRDVVTRAWPQRKVNLHVRAGEVVGIAGLVGAGRSELLHAIFGIEPPLSGQVEMVGKPVPQGDTVAAIRSGIGLIPEDRKQHGLVLEMPIRSNMSLAGLRQNRRRLGFLNYRRERRDAEQMRQRLRIKTPSIEQLARNLSGGNQQKVVLGKWLSLEPRLLMLDEPTRGIDVGAKEEIYRLIDALAGQGVGILFVSSEMEEILSLSDRVLVMHEGKLTGELTRAQMSEEAIMRLATGEMQSASSEPH